MHKKIILFGALVIFFMTSCETPQVNFDCTVSADVWINNEATVNVTIISNTPCRVRVEWGDNTVDDWGSPYQASHTYQAPGEYNARVVVTPDNQDDFKVAEKSYMIKVFKITGYNIELDWGEYPIDEEEALTLLRPVSDQILNNTFLFQGYIVAKDFDAQPVKTLLNYLDFPEDIVLYVTYKIYTPHVGDMVTAVVLEDLTTQEYIIVGEYKGKQMQFEGVNLYWFAVLLRGDVTQNVEDKEVLHSAVGKLGEEEFDIDAQGMNISLAPCKSYSTTEMERYLSEIENEIIGGLIASWSELLSNINVRINLPIVRLLDYYAGDNIEN